MSSSLLAGAALKMGQKRAYIADGRPAVLALAHRHHVHQRQYSGAGGNARSSAARPAIERTPKIVVTRRNSHLRFCVCGGCL